MIQAKQSVMGVILSLAVLLAVPQNAPLAQGEQQVSPEQTQRMMETMVPIMVGVMFGTVLDYFSDPSAAEKEAAHARNFYEALIKKGFSKQEALAIVVGYGSPIRMLSSE